MNNLSFASRTAWDNMHLQGGCVLQLDYNVLLFLREIAFLVIFSEKVLLQIISKCEWRDVIYLPQVPCGLGEGHRQHHALVK